MLVCPSPFYWLRKTVHMAKETYTGGLLGIAIYDHVFEKATCHTSSFVFYLWWLIFSFILRNNSRHIYSLYWGEKHFWTNAFNLSHYSRYELQLHHDVNDLELWMNLCMWIDLIELRIISIFILYIFNSSKIETRNAWAHQFIYKTGIKITK
jgi:hypothetical protein